MNPTIKARIESIRWGEVPEGYKRTKIGIVPTDWKERKLKNYFTRLTRKNAENNQNVLTISAQYGLISQEDFFNKSVASEDKSNYFLLKKGDFAYNKSYSNGYPYGAIKRLDYYEKGIVSPLYICLESLQENTSDYFAQYFEAGLLNKEIHAVAQEGARNHGLLNIAVEDFFNTRVVVPKVPEQEKIAEILAGQDRVIALKEKLLAEKQKQKKYLMQQLLTGKKRLPGFSGEWKEGELGDIVLECNDGSTPSRKNDDFFNGDINWVVVEDIRPYIYSTKEKLSKKGVESANLKVWKRGTVIISTCASIGLVGILCCEAATKQGITAILVNEDNSNEYVRFWLENEKSALLKFAQGSSIREIRSPILLKLKIDYPCLQEQKAIVKILLMADKEIELLKKDIGQEKLKKKSLMQLLLTGIVRVKDV